MPWVHKTRQSREGGVAITVRDDISNKTKVINDLKDQDQEIIWIEFQILKNIKIHIGTYYGKQEKEPVETVEREFSQLKTQIQKLSNNGSIILKGDFNAKLKIDKGDKKQAQSRNGKLLEEMLNTTSLTPISKESETGTLTRVNRKKTSEWSAIDCIMIKKSDCAKVTENIVDEQGTFRIKGTNDSDHNILLLSFETAIEKSTKVIQRWKLNARKGWETFNHNMSQINTRQICDYDEFESTVSN